MEAMDVRDIQCLLEEPRGSDRTVGHDELSFWSADGRSM